MPISPTRDPQVLKQGRSLTKIDLAAGVVAADHVGAAGAVIARLKLVRKRTRKSTGNSIRSMTIWTLRRLRHDRQIPKHRVTQLVPPMTSKVSLADAHAGPDAEANVRCWRSMKWKVAGSAFHRKLRVCPLPAMTIPPPIDRVDATSRVDAIAGHVVSGLSQLAVSVRSQLAVTAHEASSPETNPAVAIPREAMPVVATVAGRIEAHVHPEVELTSRQQDRFPALKRDARKVSAATRISSSLMTTKPTTLAAA